MADVDCVGDGKTKCDEVGIKNFPSIKYGNPNNLEDRAGGSFSDQEGTVRLATLLEDYTGGRDLPSLQKFAQVP